MNKQDIHKTKQAGALALDILQSQLHLPLNNGKINEDKINDHIIIAMYCGDLGPITQKVIDLAISSVQDMVDIVKKP